MFEITFSDGKEDRSRHHVQLTMNIDQDIIYNSLSDVYK